MPMYARASPPIYPGLHPLHSFYSNAKRLVHSRKHGAFPERFRYKTAAEIRKREILSHGATECRLVVGRDVYCVL
jgi:hypothetical protein